MQSFIKWISRIPLVRFFFFVLMWLWRVLLKSARKLKRYLRQRRFAGNSCGFLFGVIKECILLWARTLKSYPSLQGFAGNSYRFLFGFMKDCKLFSEKMKILISWISGAPTSFDSHYDLFHGFLSTRLSPVFADSIQKVLGKKEAWSALSRLGNDVDHGSCSTSEGQANPFSQVRNELIRNELSLVSDWLRSMVATEVPEFTSATEYYFKPGVGGKKMRIIIMLLMAKSFCSHKPDASHHSGDSSTTRLREKQCIMAGILEMIHVASLMHDDVIDEADTRRGIGSLNSVKGNKVAILAGDYLVFRLLVALASLQNDEAILLTGTAILDLLTGETMEITDAHNKSYSMEFYMQKTYNKTASLISNGCKAMAFLSAQTEEVATLAFDYGKNLGLAFQLIDDVLDFTGTVETLGKPALSDIQNGTVTAPILFAIEEFPELRAIVGHGFDDRSNLDRVVEYLKKSKGIERTRELAKEHSELAAAAIKSLPQTVNEDALMARKALVHLTQLVLTRKK